MNLCLSDSELDEEKNINKQNPHKKSAFNLKLFTLLPIETVKMYGWIHFFPLINHSLRFSLPYLSDQEYLR